MGKSLIDITTLTNIADAIRTQEGTEEPIRVEDFAERIASLVGGEVAMSTIEYIPLKDTLMTNTQAPFFISHDLGEIPNLILVINKTLERSDRMNTLWFLFYQSIIDAPYDIAFQGFGGGNYIGEYLKTNTENGLQLDLDETSLTFRDYSSNKTYLKTTQTYEFIFMKI